VTGHAFTVQMAIIAAASSSEEAVCRPPPTSLWRHNDRPAFKSATYVCLFADFRDIDKVNLIPHSWALAGRCNAAWVDARSDHYGPEFQAAPCRCRVAGCSAINSMTFSPAVMQNESRIRKGRRAAPEIGPKALGTRGGWPPIPSPWCWR